MQTSRDREIVAWLGELGGAGATHVAVRFGMGRTTSYRRLQLLVADGLLAERRLLYKRPALYTATADGLRWTGLQRLGHHRINPAAYEHAWAVATVAVELHERPGWRLLSERTLRVLEAEQQTPIATVEVRAAGGAGAAQSRHRPDLALLTGQGTVALEVELTVKAPRRLQAILTGYARARHLHHTVYLTNAATRRPVERAIEEVRADDRVAVVALPELHRLPDLLAAR